MTRGSIPRCSRGQRIYDGEEEEEIKNINLFRKGMTDNQLSSIL
jgi:hypothetical protein